MLIAIIIVICSGVGLSGFFFENPIMFYAGGMISFSGFVRYIFLETRRKDLMSVQNIRFSSSYQRNKYSPIYKASNEEETKSLIKQFMVSNFVSRAVVYLLACGLFYWFGSWDAFMWIGIIFGFGYLLELKQLFKKKSLYTLGHVDHMENIVTYCNDSRGVFCQIKLGNGERLFISCSQNGVKMHKLLFGYFPLKTFYRGNLEEALKLFSDPEHWGQSILDLIIGKFVNSTSIAEVSGKVNELKSKNL